MGEVQGEVVTNPGATTWSILHYMVHYILPALHYVNGFRAQVLTASDGEVS